MNSNKRSLGTTLLVFVVCLVIVTGSPFSLFTSESKVDIAVTSGNVDVQAIVGEYTLTSMGKTMDNDTFENGGTVTFADKVFTVSNITPGDYLNIPVAITNKSDVKVQYCVVWEVEGPLDGILDATVDGTPIVNDTSLWMPIDFNETIDIVINVGMDIDETRGEGLSADDTVIKFVVKAVQANGAKNPIVATTPDELVDAFESAQSGDIIDANGLDFDISGSVEIPSGVTVKGLSLTSGGSNNYIVATTGDEAITFEDCTFDTTDFTNKVFFGSNAGGSDIVFNNCTFAGQVYSSYANNPDANVTYTNCTFSLGSGNVGFVNCMGGNQTFNNCTFNYAGGSTFGSSSAVKWSYVNSYSESGYRTNVVLNGCTLNGCGTYKNHGNSTLTVN